MEKELLLLLNKLRGLPYHSEELIKIIYTFKVWKNLSDNKNISNRNLFFSVHHKNNITEVFKELSNEYKIFKLFKNSIDISKLEEEYFLLIFNFVLNIELVAMYDAMDTILGSRNTLTISSQIAEFSVKLLDDDSDTDIYTPFSNSFNIAYYTNKIVYAESYVDGLTVELIKILNNLKIEFRQTDVLVNPSYAEKNKLKQFNHSISFPPFSVRKNSDILHNDIFNRFNIYQGQTLLDVAHFEHILSQTKEKSVILTSVGFSFRGGIDKSFRKYLIDKNWLEAIVHLPPNLHNNTSIETLFFIVNKKKKTNKVFFLNLRDEQFIKKDGRKIILRDLDKIINIYKEQNIIENISSLVTNNKIVENDYFFSVDRYIISDKILEIQGQLEKYSTINLEDVSDIRKSQLFKDEDKGMEVYEISPKDFSDAGYTLEVGKLKHIDSQYTKYETYKILSDDILISTKGTIGKIAIIGKIKNPMIASQAIQIIRVIDKDKVDPIFLYMFLKSSIGQALLSKLVSGSVMPQISTKDIKEFKIPLPPIKNITIVKDSFLHERQLHMKIEDINRKINSLHSDFLGVGR